MLDKIKTFWKEEIFFSFDTIKRLGVFGILPPILILICFCIFYSKISYVILGIYLLSLFIDIKKSNTKIVLFYNIFGFVTLMLYLLYLLVILK